MLVYPQLHVVVCNNLTLYNVVSRKLLIVTETAEPEELWDDEDLQPLVPAGVTMQSYLDFNQGIVTSSTASCCIEKLLSPSQEEEEAEEQEYEVPYVSRNEAWNHVIGLSKYMYALRTDNEEPLSFV